MICRDTWIFQTVFLAVFPRYNTNSSDLDTHFLNPDILLECCSDALIEDAVSVTDLEDLAILCNLADVDAEVFLHLGRGVNGLLEAGCDRNAPTVRNILNGANTLLLYRDVLNGGSEGRSEVAEKIVNRFGQIKKSPRLEEVHHLVTSASENLTLIHIHNTLYKHTDHRLVSHVFGF